MRGVVWKLLEEADVLHDAAGQEMIVLHHGLDLAAIGALAPHRQHDAVDQHRAVGRLEQPDHDLDQRGLAAAGRAPDMGSPLVRLVYIWRDGVPVSAAFDPEREFNSFIPADACTVFTTF
jgi:hypothetical protein